MSVESKAAPAAEQKATGKAWFMLVIVYLLSVAVPILWFSLPPMLADNTILGVFLNGDQTQVAAVGNTMSMVSLGAMVSAVLATFLVKAIKLKNTLLLGALLAIVGGVVMALSAGDGMKGSGDFTILIVGRVIVGLGVGLVGVTSPTAITTWFPGKVRGLAIGIWATWVPVGIIIATNLLVNPLKGAFPGSHGMEPFPFSYSLPQVSWWVMIGLLVVTTLLVAVFYKAPETNTGVSAETKPIKEVLPFFKQYQVIMLAIVWLAFNYVNYCFTTYAPIYFAGGFGDAGMGAGNGIMTTGEAAFWGSISSALGILAPIPAAIYDRLKRNMKWVIIAFGALILALTAVTGFRNEMGPFNGWTMFYLYLACNAIGNMCLVGCIRPYVPLLVGRGGATAVTLGLSLVTFL
ncbi:MAG: MFS transporter, partial [Coriobacteriaceae bacterium]|nr:MFS transporter [Coriobacteriaceae bacterium]